MAKILILSRRNSKNTMYATIFDYPEKPHLARNDRDQAIKREMEERQMNANSTLLSRILSKKRSARTWDVEDLIVWDPKVSRTSKVRYQMQQQAISVHLMWH